MAKDPKEKKLTVAEEKEILINYLKRQNRPYNGNDVFTNLKGAIPKTQVLKLLAALLEAELIQGKAYGKQMIFAPKQDVADLPSANVLQKMDADIKAIKERILVGKDALKTAERQLASLNASRKTEDMPPLIQEYQEKIETITARLANVESKGNQMSATDRTRIDKEFVTIKTEWRKRRKLFNSIWDPIVENYAGKPKDLKEELGIEDDVITIDSLAKEL